MEEMGCKYSVVRFVPDPIRNEPRNIGLIFQIPERKMTWAWFTEKLKNRIGSLISEGELNVLKTFIDNVKSASSKLKEGQEFIPGSEPYILNEKYLEELKSKNYGKIQFTEPAGVLTKDPKKELVYLVNTFLGQEEEQPAKKRSRLKTQLKKDFVGRNILKTERNKHGFEENVVLQKGLSHTEYTVDFAYRNGRVVVVETLDLTNAQEGLNKKTFESVFKMIDLEKSLKKKFVGLTVVNAKREDDLVRENIKPFETYSNVFRYFDTQERGKFLNILEKSVHGANLPQYLFKDI